MLLDPLPILVVSGWRGHELCRHSPVCENAGDDNGVVAHGLDELVHQRAAIGRRKAVDCEEQAMCQESKADDLTAEPLTRSPVFAWLSRVHGHFSGTPGYSYQPDAKSKPACRTIQVCLRRISPDCGLSAS